MKRSEFLKRLSLGIGAAVAVPALLKGEDRIIDESDPFKRTSNDLDKSLVKSGEEIKFLRRENTTAISSAPTWALYNKQKGYVDFFNHVT